MKLARAEVASLIACALLLPFDAALHRAGTALCPHIPGAMWLLNALGHASGLAVSGLALPALLISPRRWRLIGGCAAALAATSGAVQLLKFAIGRARPEYFAALGAWHFEPFHEFRHRIASMPSGHAASLAVCAVFFAAAYPRGRHVFWLIAGLCAMERFVTAQHYLSDIAAGFAVGSAAAGLILRWLERASLRRASAP